MDTQLIHQFIKNALAEDVGDGDHTSLSTIPNGTQGRAKLIIKEEWNYKNNKEWNQK